MGHEQVWNVPYARNPFFTGREQLLTQLAEVLHMGKATALSQPQAISGLGGIGKTQIAVEYAYQHRQDYQAVLWTRADTSEALVSGYVEIANRLNLPQKDEQDQTLVVNAVLQWLKSQTGWLLILDNADDLGIISAFLPPDPGGHIPCPIDGGTGRTIEGGDDGDGYRSTLVVASCSSDCTKCIV